MHLGAVDKRIVKKDRLGSSLVAPSGDFGGIQHLHLQRTQEVKGDRWAV